MKIPAIPCVLNLFIRRYSLIPRPHAGYINICVPYWGSPLLILSITWRLYKRHLLENWSGAVSALSVMKLVTSQWSYTHSNFAAKITYFPEQIQVDIYIIIICVIITYTALRIQEKAPSYHYDVRSKIQASDIVPILQAHNLPYS